MVCLLPNHYFQPCSIEYYPPPPISHFGTKLLFCLLLTCATMLPSQAQDTLGIVIEATAQYAPAAGGLSQDDALNQVLRQYQVERYVQAYPFGKSEVVLNSFRIILADQTEYLRLIDDLQIFPSFSEVVVEAEGEVDCPNPASYNDPGSQGNYDHPLEVHNFPCAWDITTGSPDVTVAVSDIFFDDLNPDMVGVFSHIENALVPCNSGQSCICDPAFRNNHDPSNGVTNDHGFATAGAIAAIVNNGICNAGAGHSTKVAGYCVGTSATSGWPGWGMNRAYEDGEKIINVSWSGYNGTSASVIHEMVSNGVTIVASARGDTWGAVRGIEGVIRVGQLNRQKNYIPYDVWEPEVDIYTSCLWVSSPTISNLQSPNNCRLNRYGGSSYGAPLVSSCVALMKSVNPGLCPDMIEQIIKSTHQGLPANAAAWNSDPANVNRQITAGVLDAEAAVLAARDYGKYTITGNVTWNTDRYVSELVIEPGAELTITGGATIKFSHVASALVKRGARLIVDNATLTNNQCGGDQWRGIRVWGNANLPQPSNPYGTLNANEAGVVILRNNARIEHARDGVSTFHGMGAPGPWGSHWGGLIIAENTTFSMNRRGVEFMKYDFPNQSTVTNCVFEGDGQTQDNGQVGVTMWDTDGVIFTGCTFRDMTREGIVGYNASPVVDNNTFESNEKGIQSIATFPFATNMRVENNFFDDNWFHIESDATDKWDGLIVLDNEFFEANTAIWLDGPARFGIERNQFDLATADISGLRTSALQSNAYKLIKENTFSSIFGIIMAGENRDVEFLCNEFETESIDFDLKQRSGVSGEIRKFQGGPADPANNCFTRPINTADIFTNQQPTELFYYYTPQNHACKEPLSPGNYLKQFTSDKECGSQFQLPPAEGIYEEYLNTRALLLHFNFEGTPEVEYYDLLVWKERLLMALLEDYVANGEFASADQLLDLEGTVAAQLIKYGLQVDRGEYATATQTLAAMPDSVLEMPTFKKIQKINLDLYQTLNLSLNANDSTFLDSVARSEMGVRAYARGLLHLMTGQRFTDGISPDGNLRRAAPTPEPEAESTAVEPIRVYPNPAREQLLVAVPDGIDISTLKLLSPHGKVVNRQQLEQAPRTIKLSVSEFAPGIYVLVLFDRQGKAILQEKVSILK